ncbi:iron chelate uptake ABC transporter family permease subunit [Nonomuraea gerenzanensis]|uniref:ABC-type Fe3+-siderophore transport system, permease component n=1 Tax=Nonomuraea gerenzanensis TaxID=93944 RepID=A0A1M4E1V4_9ACTN|nr:ABC-type Fe3+-siderophore transport system, permease component [Nonomuraea gerenzanensis]
MHDLRLPRTLLGRCVGLALGLARALMQGLTRNPPADPGLLGVDSGASLAAVCSILFFGGCRADRVPTSPAERALRGVRPEERALSGNTDRYLTSIDSSM